MLRHTSKKFVILTAAILLNPFICGEELIRSSSKKNSFSSNSKAENFINLSRQSHQLAMEIFNKSEKFPIEKSSKYDNHAKKIIDERACNHLANSIYFTVQAMNNGGIKKNVPNLFENTAPFFVEKEMRKKMHNAMHKKAKNTLSKNECKNLANLMLNQGLFNQALNQMADENITIQKQGQNNFLRALKQTTAINPSPAMLKFKHKVGDEALFQLKVQVMTKNIELPEYLKWDIENLAQQFDESFGNKLSKLKFNPALG